MRREKTDLEKRKMALQEQQFADERDTKKAKEQAEIEKQRADIAATQANTHLLQIGRQYAAESAAEELKERGV